MVGHVLIEAQHHHGVGHIGRVAVAPDRRGRGLGTALMRATVRHGFDEMGLHRLQLMVYTFNVAAIATYRSVGFVVDGVARESAQGSRGRWDGLTMSLLEPEYLRPPDYGDGIRIAGPRDAQQIAALLTALGYPHEPGQAAARLLAWAAEAQGEVLVAEVSTKRQVAPWRGWWPSIACPTSSGPGPSLASSPSASTRDIAAPASGGA